MRVSEVLIVPSAGHTSAEGRYTRGRDNGFLAEVDLVDKYVTELADTLDGEGIRFRVLETRKTPGLKEGGRHLAIPAHSLVVHCAIGWHENYKKTSLMANFSRVLYGDSSVLGLAREVGEALGHWGELYVHGHKAGKPMEDREDRLLTVEQSWGIRVEPFLLNGPSASEYARRLPVLGKDLGRVLTAFLRTRGLSLAVRPSTIVYG